MHYFSRKKACDRSFFQLPLKSYKKQMCTILSISDVVVLIQNNIYFSIHNLDSTLIPVSIFLYFQTPFWLKLRFLVRSIIMMFLKQTLRVSTVCLSLSVSLSLNILMTSFLFSCLTEKYWIFWNTRPPQSENSSLDPRPYLSWTLFSMEHACLKVTEWSRNE